MAFSPASIELREQLRCKEIWVVGADRYRNPDEDVPADFESRRAVYYAALGLPRDADVFVDRLRTEMQDALHTLNAGCGRLWAERHHQPDRLLRQPDLVSPLEAGPCHAKRFVLT